MSSAKRCSRVFNVAFAVALAVVAIGCSAAGPGGVTPTRTGDPSPTNVPIATDKPVETSEPIVLRMANTYGELAQLPALEYFVERVHELSGGRIRISVADAYGDFAPDVEERVVRHVAEGKMDLGWVGTRVIDTMGVKSFQALTAPRLVDSYALQNALIVGGLTTRMLPALDELGVMGLGVLADGLRKPIGVNEPILGPADWQGIGFGTYTSASQEVAIRALGATPEPVFGPNRELAIATDTIGGFEMGLFIYQDPKWVDLAPYVTANVSLWPQMDLLIASPARLDSLTTEQRGWIQAAADGAASRSAAFADTDAAAIRAACDAGARFARASDADLAALDDSFATVYTSLERDPETAAFIEEIRALKQSIPAADPVIPAGCAETGTPGDPTATAAAPADSLQGEWHQTFTCDGAAEAVRRGVPPQVVESSEWSCDFTGAQLRIARFQDGRLFLMDPPSHEVGLSATYELVDDHTFTLTDGDENIPGAYRFEYRIEGDRLIVDVLEEDPFFVGAWEAAPFVRAD